MKFILNLILDNWIFLGPIIYEIIARLWPTKWNVSILDAIWKVIGIMIPNNREPDGTETLEKSNGIITNKIKVKVGKHIVRVLIPLFMFCNFAEAQIWQAYKGVRYVNSGDSSTWLPVGGTITYNDATHRLMGYDTAWFNLRGSGGGGGAFWPLSGTASTTGTNIINGGNKQLLNTTGGAPPQRGGIEAVAGSYAMFSLGTSYATASAGIQIASPSAINVKGIAPFGGIKYESDYSANFTDRSLIDYGNAVPRLIDGNSVSLNVTNFGTFDIFSDNTFGAGSSQLTFQDGTASFVLTATNFSENTTIYGSQADMFISDSKAVKTGLRYVASGYVTQPRSLADKEYVDTKITGTTTTNNISYGVAGTRTIGNENAFSYNPSSNQFTVQTNAGSGFFQVNPTGAAVPSALITNLSNNANTTFFAGEIQFDDTNTNEDVTFNLGGINHSNASNSFQIVSDGGLDMVSTGINPVQVTSGGYIQLDADSYFTATANGQNASMGLSPSGQFEVLPTPGADALISLDAGGQLIITNVLSDNDGLVLQIGPAGEIETRNNIASTRGGTYIATLTNGVNATSLSALTASFAQTGNTCIVYINASINVTNTSTLTSFDISLPINSDLATLADVIGNGSSMQNIGGIIVNPNLVSDTAVVSFNSGSTTGAVNIYINFAYHLDVAP